MKRAADRALAAERFVEEWKSRGQEDEHDETFWNQFLQEVMGIDRVHHIIDYQKKVKIDGSWKRIDAYIPASKVLIEQKTKGIDLVKKAKQSDDSELSPYDQALRYAAFLPTNEQPNYIITSNFQEFRIYDRNNDPAGENPVVIGLEELPQQLPVFSFIVDPVNKKIARQQQVNLDAAKLIGELYESIKEQYHDPDTSRHDLAVLMVRILFCLYAEDSGLFEQSLFYDYLKKAPAGEGLFRDALMKLFGVLDTPEDKRDPYLGDTLSRFPYVNGGLFANDIEVPIFNDSIKYQMLQQTSYEFNWSEISPVIFGSIFESILSGDERRAGGMHYTSVENIHKVIDPLFLNDLRLEYQKAGNSKAALRKLQDKIASLKFLDPACGSGNFLTETYLELRALENEILGKLVGDQMAIEFQEEGLPSFVKVNVGQFYGIEINDFAVSVANTALWIADHQSNRQTAKIVNRPIVNLPLKKYENIVCANALRIDWNDILPSSECRYIMGNPPFLGSSVRNKMQTEDMECAFHGETKWGKCDYCVGWYRKASKYMSSTKIRAAFVSTSSICQGEQVEPTWKRLFDDGININFARKSFIWDSETPDKAHVHCIIVGFSYITQELSTLFDGGKTIHVQNINGYLVEAPNVFIKSRTNAIDEMRSKIKQGNKPVDGGNLVLNEAEAEQLIEQYPELQKYVRLYIGSREFINNKKRYCLWLKDASPALYANNREVNRRLQAVSDFRAQSPTKEFREYSQYPTLFVQDRQPDTAFIAIPEVSSERRRYIPIGYLDSEVVVSNKIFFIPTDSLFYFGILCSQFHNAWMRVVAGRLKSDYSYSPSVYNSFAFPEVSSDQKGAIEDCARNILAIRDEHQDSSLANLYNPLTMPPNLTKAHNALNRAVEQAYGVSFDGDEEKIVAHLFKLYSAVAK